MLGSFSREYYLSVQYDVMTNGHLSVRRTVATSTLVVVQRERYERHGRVPRKVITYLPSWCSVQVAIFPARPPGKKFARNLSFRRFSEIYSIGWSKISTVIRCRCPYGGHKTCHALPCNGGRDQHSRCASDNTPFQTLRGRVASVATGVCWRGFLVENYLWKATVPLRCVTIRHEH